MWTWDEIETEWLSVELPPEFDERFARLIPMGHPQDEVVAAFDKVEACFGRSWIEGQKRPMVSWPQALQVFGTGKCLEALDGVGGDIDKLMDALRQHSVTAKSEAQAFYLIRGDLRDIEAEHESPVSVGGRNPRPEYRVRLDPLESWTYVEVVRPDDSKDQKALRPVQERLAAPISDIHGPISVDVAMHRQPTEVEITDLEARLRNISQGTGWVEETLPNELGRVVVNHSDPEGNVVREGPGLVSASVRLGGEGQAPRLTVAIAFSDPRAAVFLGRKAKKLPKDAPGLLMMDIGNAVGASRDWQAVMEKRFRDGNHTRVGGVCLFQCYATIVGSSEKGVGAKWGLAGSYFENPYAPIQIPAWISSSLSALASIGEALSGI